MKKLLTLALALTLTLALSVSAFAATIVGPSGGVTDFAPTTSDDTKVDVKVTVGDVVNKYAVDIDFTDLTVNVNGSALTWNVDTFQYDTSGFSAPADAATKSTVTFTNRSDLPVKVSYDMDDKDANDMLSVTITDSAANVIAEGAQQTIAKATPKTGTTPGSATTYVFNLAVIANDGANATTNEAADWNAVANYYAAYFANNPGTGVRTVATVTFTVAKAS